MTPLDRLEHILVAVDLVTRYARVSKASFLRSPMRQDAIVRRLEVIGEAAKSLPEELKALAPSVPWRDVQRMRDFLIHVYFGVDPEVVWDTVQHDLPRFRDAVQGLRDALLEQNGA